MKISKEIVIGVAIGTSFGIAKAVATNFFLKKRIDETRKLEEQAHEGLNNFMTSVNEDLANEQLEAIKKIVEKQKESERETWEELKNLKANGNGTVDAGDILRISRKLY